MESKTSCCFCSKRFTRRLDVLRHEDVCDENPLEIPRTEQNRFKLSAPVSYGVERKYKMFFNDDSSTEWLASLHDAIMNDTWRLLVDIGREEEGLFEWSLRLKLTGKQNQLHVNAQIFIKTLYVILSVYNLRNDLQIQMETLLKKIEQYERNLFGWRVHQLISITASVVKIDTKLSGLNHIHHDDCPGNMSCHFPPHSDPSFLNWK